MTDLSWNQVDRRAMLKAGAMAVLAMATRQAESVPVGPESQKKPATHSDHLNQQWADAQAWSTIHGCE